MTQKQKISQKLDTLTVIDLELTCHEKDQKPKNFKPEIIEIGISVIDVPNMTIKSNERFYCKPKDKVSDYCTNLTGITNQILKEKGRPFNEVASTIRKKYGSKQRAWTAWGDDQNDLIQEIKKHSKCVMPFEGAFINYSLVFHSLYGFEKRTNLQNALTYLGLSFVGTPHQAKDDAFNTARLILEMMRRMRPLII